MKKILIAIFTILSLGASAQGWRDIHLGIHTGLDLGAAVPWPINKAIGGGDKMNATPHITPALGLSVEYQFLPRWSLVAEATYKTVALDASIITLRNGQKFQDDGFGVTFYGRAKMSMSFSMLEVPLYFKFKINDNNRVFLGGYYAYVADSKFVATAMDGRLEKDDQQGGTTVDIIKPDSPFVQDFDDNLDNWDTGFQVGYERKVWKKLTLSGRVSVGFKDIFKPNENYLDYSMWNMRGTLTLAYRIF